MKTKYKIYCSLFWTFAPQKQNLFHYFNKNKINFHFCTTLYYVFSIYTVLKDF